MTQAALQARLRALEERLVPAEMSAAAALPPGPATAAEPEKDGASGTGGKQLQEPPEPQEPQERPEKLESAAAAAALSERLAAFKMRGVDVDSARSIDADGLTPAQRLLWPEMAKQKAQKAEGLTAAQKRLWPDLAEAAEGATPTTRQPEQPAAAATGSDLRALFDLQLAELGSQLGAGLRALPFPAVEAPGSALTSPLPLAGTAPGSALPPLP
ncbi:unnamed protein product, partial [Prorocentrum cordatum]